MILEQFQLVLCANLRKMFCVLESLRKHVKLCLQTNFLRRQFHVSQGENTWMNEEQVTKMYLL